MEIDREALEVLTENAVLNTLLLSDTLGNVDKIIFRRIKAASVDSKKIISWETLTHIGKGEFM